MSNTQVVEVQEIEQLNTVQGDRASSLALITNGDNMAKVMSLAKAMASSKVTVPKHLQGSEGDCMAIIIQASNWGMNPFAVAQKTHLVNGVLGYEAQLVNAVIQTSGSIEGVFHYEYKDEVGKAPNNSVSCRVGAVLRGRDEITWGEWLDSSSITTRNSPLWKTNLKQQMGYLQVKNWSRLYCPAAILGVYTDDELQDVSVPKNVTPVRGGAAIAEAAKHADVSEDTANERIALLKQLTPIAEKKGLVAYAEAWGVLSAHQRKVVGTVEHERLKVVANAFDESRTYENQPSTTSAEVDADFVGEMNEAEANK